MDKDDVATNSTDIEELFVHASGLEDTQREAFLGSLRERDANLGDVLVELLAADDFTNARVPQDPRLTDAQLAARSAMGQQEPIELDVASRAILDRVAQRSSSFSRYSVRSEIGRGGMGVVLEVWDVDLQRKLAMKVALNPGHQTEAFAANSITVARFLEEAQVTGQLDHPGIVPVHELGLDDQQRVFFTMRYVRGRPLDEILGLVRENSEGWNTVRALNVFLKVCEAMAYAHSKAVIHRDLKPANIMVGRFGEVYVMDWGVARVVIDKDGVTTTVKPRHDFTTSLDPVRTARASSRDEGTADPLLTRDGSVLGTPYFMPVEQAAGDFDKVDARSDVYAVGAMLYQLITGTMPYKIEGQRMHPHAILAKVLNGPPRPISDLAPSASVELSAICNKAMARKREDRYPDMLALAEDLRAYLENRVVRAYATGPLVELRKWVMRNKAVAAAGLLAFFLVLAGGLVFFLQAKRLTAEKEARDYRTFMEYARLSEGALLNSSEMWPATPDKIGTYDQWLAEANQWLTDARGILGKLRERQVEGQKTSYYTPEALELQHLHELARIDTTENSLIPSKVEVSNFDDPEDGRLHDLEVRLESAIFSFEDPIGGYIQGKSSQLGWGVEKRRDWADHIEEKTVTGPKAQRRWAQAIEAIATSPLYGGLVIEPQLGLLPVGAGPKSGIWEFCLLQTGRAPIRDDEHFLRLDDDIGLVFVLVPGGTFVMGSQNIDPQTPNFDPDSNTDEQPIFDVTLQPYFISKYEMNQAQWVSLTGHNPSSFNETPWNPVENVKWADCLRVLGWIGCTLPTEAQWEYAARAETDTPWWTGKTVKSLTVAGNIADRSLGDSYTDKLYTTELQDFESYVAEAFHYDSNKYGLHGTIGNLWEWCLDEYTDGYTDEPQEERFVPPTGNRRVARGGCYTSLPRYARVANRSPYTNDFVGNSLGLRPVRKIQGEIRYE